MECKVKHLRLHHELIQGLCKDKYLTPAILYFKRLLHKEMTTKFKRNLTSSQRTLELFALVLLSNQDSTSKKLVDMMIDYMENGDYKATIHMTEYFRTLYTVIGCRTDLCVVPDPLSCVACGAPLLHDDNSYFFLEDICESIRKKLVENGGHSFLQSLNMKNSKSKAYDYVFDAANIFSSRSSGNINRPDIRRFEAVLLSLVKQNQQNHLTIACILPRWSSNKKSDLTQYLQRLQQRLVMTCQIDLISNHKVDDDLLVLYMAAKSAFNQQDKQRTYIVSNDSFSNYKELVPRTSWLKFAGWLRSTIKNFDSSGNVILRPYFPVIKQTADKLHIQCDGGKLLCISIPVNDSSY